MKITMENTIRDWIDDLFRQKNEICAKMEQLLTFLEKYDNFLKYFVPKVYSTIEQAKDEVEKLDRQLGRIDVEIASLQKVLNLVFSQPPSYNVLGVDCTASFKPAVECTEENTVVYDFHELKKKKEQ